MSAIVKYLPTRNVITQKAEDFLYKNYMYTGKREILTAVEEFACFGKLELNPDDAARKSRCGKALNEIGKEQYKKRVF